MVVASTTTTASSSTTGDEGPSSHRSNTSKRTQKVSISEAAQPENDSQVAGTSGDASQPSSSGIVNTNYIESFVQMGIGQICHNIGWNAIGSMSLDILTEITGAYIKSLGRTSSRFANQAGRSHVTLSDVVLSFDQLHFDLNELQDYVTTVDPHPVGIRPCKVPASLRPSNRIPHCPPGKFPFHEDTVIGYAVTESEDSDEEESEDEEAEPMETDEKKEDNSMIDPVTGLVNASKKKGKKIKEKVRVPMKRSDYYESWMPPFPDLNVDNEKEDDHQKEDLNASLSQDESSMTTSAVEDNLINGLKLSELEPSLPLTSVYLNSQGQLIPVNGTVPVRADKSFPEYSDPESVSDSDDEESENNLSFQNKSVDDHGVGGLYSTEGKSLVDKITIKKTKKKETGFKRGQGGDKLNRLISKQTSNKSDKPKAGPVLSIKVSGLLSSTPTASPKLPGSSEPLIPLAPEVAERIDDTLDSVIASVMSVKQEPKVKRTPKDGKKPRESKAEKALREKEFVSKEFVDDDDDDSSSDDDENGRTGIMELLPPVLSNPTPSSIKSSPSKVTEKKKCSDNSVDSFVRNTMRSPSRSSMSPDRMSHGSNSSSKRSKSNKKPSIKESPPKMPDTDAADLLLSFASNPVDDLSRPGRPDLTAPEDSSPFNLGKILEKAKSQTSPQINQVEAPVVAPIRTLAMKKAVFTSERRPQDTDSDLSDAEDVEKKSSKKKKVKDEDEEEEKKRARKEKKKKKKESKDRDREKKKKDKKKDKKDRDVSTPDSAVVPKINIKLGSKSDSKATDKKKELDKKTAKKEKSETKAASCVLISETINVSKSVKKEPIKKDTEKKKVKEEDELKKGGRKSSVASNSGKGKKSKKDDSIEMDSAMDEDGKVWICPSCKQPDDGSPMIGCDICEEWYHWVCVGIKVDPEEDSWFCPKCTGHQKKVEQLVKPGGKRKHSIKDDDDDDDDSDVETKKKGDGSIPAPKKKKRKKNPG